MHVITRLLRAGSEENTITSCLGAASQGHRVTLVHGCEFDARYYATLRPQIELIEVPELVHPIRPIMDMKATMSLRNLFREIQPDIVHTHQSKAGIIGRAAAKMAKVPRIVHGVHIAPFINVSWHKRALYIAAEKLAARSTDAFICVSEEMKNACLAAGIGEARKYHVVYSGMPLDKFIDAPLPDDWRDLLGISATDERPPVILMLAAFEKRKRHLELIEAFARVVARHPETRLLLAGDGPLADTVRSAVSTSGLERNIRLLGFHSEPGKLVALSDMCLLTSRREGLPRVVVQYIAGGRPVIVTRVPGIEEIVSPGVSGIITDPDDMQDLADEIIKLLDDPARLNHLQSGARNTDVSPWHEHALIDGTLAVYAKI